MPTTIEELRAERDRLYDAWIDAECDLELALEEEAERQLQNARTRKFIFFSAVGATIGFVLTKWWTH